eukprot:1147497-Pelagomonas_calceolata.AAC.2
MEQHQHTQGAELHLLFGCCLPVCRSCDERAPFLNAHVHLLFMCGGCSLLVCHSCNERGSPSCSSARAHHEWRLIFACMPSM